MSGPYPVPCRPPMSDPTTLPPLPSSPYYEIRDTTYGGRGVFAKTDLVAGTALLRSPTPSASVIYREFRLEACAECFAYDLGRTWKIGAADKAVRFCSEQCRDTWEARVGPAGIRAWEATEAWVRTAKNLGDDEITAEAPDENTIEQAWTIVGTLDGLGARALRKELTAAHGFPAYPDTLAFLLSGIITAYEDPSLFAETMHLAPTTRPYSSSRVLASHVASLRTLRAILPAELVPFATPQVARALVARDARNSFAMWTVPEDDGAEMLGFGIWPNASFFNHACAPSVAKRRVGREWQFALEKDVREGEEMCISYIGETELRSMDVEARRRTLKDSWGFECICTRCTDESAGLQ